MDNDSALPMLIAGVREALRRPELESVLRRHAGLDGAGPPLRTDIHDKDQMLLHSLHHHRDVNAAVSQYYNVALQQFRAARQLLHGAFPDAAERERVQVLDFACGYGRLLRFLTLELPLERIHAAEIMPDALDYVQRAFGVEVTASHVDPAAFDPGRRFDFIWVASLFSHLPEPLFRQWLARLTALLTPRGVLCFSVHDETLLPPGVALPGSGILFGPESENSEIDPAAYGTTYVSEAFVADAIAGALSSAHRYRRIPRALAHEQDVYVVPADADRQLPAPDAFRRGAWGWVDERRRLDNGGLYLRGWAASIDDGALAAVDVHVDGARYRVPTGLLREDVRDAFADDRLRTAGWEFAAEPVAPDRPLLVDVSAAAGPGESALLYFGEFPGVTPAGQPGVARAGVVRRLLRRLVG